VSLVVSVARLVGSLGGLIAWDLKFPRTKQTLSNLVTVPTPLKRWKIVGRTHARGRHECQFGTRRVRPIKGPYTRDVVLLAVGSDHASASRLLGQILR
jgi:hypothetical protein